MSVMMAEVSEEGEKEVVAKSTSVMSIVIALSVACFFGIKEMTRYKYKYSVSHGQQQRKHN